MRTGALVGVCSALAVLCLASWGADPAHADPSDACRDLAARFANSAGDLGVGSLASLITCVTAEIQGRADDAEGAPPPAPQQVVPPPPTPPPAPEQQAATPPAREWGSWPLRAPWTFIPSESSSWDR
jgi:hypothetical protein